MKLEAGPSCVIDFSNLPCDTEAKVTLVARPLLSPVGVVTNGTCVNSPTSLRIDAAVREAFSSACPGKKVPNKTTVHRLVAEFRDTVSVCL
jgi:hypothetical protein